MSPQTRREPHVVSGNLVLVDSSPPYHFPPVHDHSNVGCAAFERERDWISKEGEQGRSDKGEEKVMACLEGDNLE